MSATITFGIMPALSGWSLGTNVRNILDANSNAVRIELSPQSVLVDSEFETAQSWSSGASLGSWSILNNGNLTTLDENTSWPSGLYCYLPASGTNLDFDAGTHSSPFVYQTLTGDFDVFAGIHHGDTHNYASIGLMALLDGSPTNYVKTNVYVDAETANPGYGSNAIAAAFKSVTSGSNTYVASPRSTGKDLFIMGRLFLRLKKAGSSFSAYCSSDAANWTPIGTTQTRSDLSGTTLDLGVEFGKPDNSSTTIFSGFCDFIRNTLPYDTTGPTASVAIDSGVAGTTWNMSTFKDYLYPQTDGGWTSYSKAGFGSNTYDYGASDTNPPSLSGTYRSTASMQAQANPTGRYFKLSVKLTSAHGYDLASFSGATIQGVVATSGGPVGQQCQ